MKFHAVSFATLGLALVGGAPMASAQTLMSSGYYGLYDTVVAPPAGAVWTQEPLATTVVQPAQTVQTVETIRTVPVTRTTRRFITTRTITRRIISTPTVVARTVTAAPQPLYDTVAAPLAARGDYYGRRPIYDEVVLPAAPAPLAAMPVMQDQSFSPMIYRYVYEPDRILVIDPTTNTAVQAIPR
jgi:hypothetical protein